MVDKALKACYVQDDQSCFFTLCFTQTWAFPSEEVLRQNLMRSITPVPFEIVGQDE